jgi:uncharacterized protein YcfJ
MKHTLWATALILSASTAFAETDMGVSVKAHVNDHYRVYEVEVPYTKEECVNVDRPIYGQDKFDQGDAIVGGIIGGLIGNQFGGGSGKDAMTGLGAITGAIVGGKKDGRVVGYKKERICDDVYYTQVEERVEYDYSVIEFKHNGKKYTVKFRK